ncbi:hypothetical protein LEMLEM_LOCUS24067 [Lemmus lemmus]
MSLCELPAWPRRAIWIDQLVGAYYGPKKLLMPVSPEPHYPLT